MPGDLQYEFSFDSNDVVTVIGRHRGAWLRAYMPMEAYQYFISLVKRDECLQHELYDESSILFAGYP